jgi:NADH:ubiquinone reductase (non-electrogenic)
MASIAGSSGVIINRLIDLYYGKTEYVKPKKDIVVIGYGWGSQAFCKNIDTSKYNVTVISKSNEMLNTTKLKNSITDENDKLLLIKNENKKINFINDECINLKNFNQVNTKNKTYLYDYLVIAVGSETNDFNIPGVKQNCLYLKTLEDLDKLKLKLKNDSFKDKKIAILGAGPVGIELAFQLAKEYKEIKIIEAMPNILPMFNENTINIVKEELDKAGIKLLLNNKVTKIDPNLIKSNDNNLERLTFFDIAIWNCGVKPHSLLKTLTNDKFKVDNYLRYNSSIFAIGDIVASKEFGPPTAQNAKKQGIYLANYFNNNFIGNPYKFEEDGRVLRTKNNLIIETSYGSFKMPMIFETVYDKIILK